MSVGLRYKDKVTIITGGSSGIGKGCACVFIRHGSKAVICSNIESQGLEAEKELNAIGSPGEAKFVFCDITKEEDVKNLISKTVELYGRIDCVINNAGWHPPYKTIDEYTAEEFTSLMNVNVLGCFLVSKYALPHLRKTQGNIINTSSMEAHAGVCWSTIYGATKGAVVSFTRSLAVEEAKNNVRVNSISPGAIDTPLLDSFITNATDPEKAGQAMRDLSVFGRVGLPEEYGTTCLYLAADATYSTGTDIKPSGGMELNFGCKNVHSKTFWPRAMDP